MRVVVFSCAHVAPRQDLTRFRELGRYIVDRKPAQVISLGDFVTVESLSSWDEGKPGVMADRTYQSDINCGALAVNLMKQETENFNDIARAQRKKTYTPKWVFINGNHEYRVERWLDKVPVMRDKVNIENDLGLYHLDNRELLPYKASYSLGGVTFKHCMVGDNGKAISRTNIENYALEESGTSVVFGHHHFLLLKSKQRANAPLIHALCVGTFSEHKDKYLFGANPNIWRGFVELELDGMGGFELETWSIKKLRRHYGNL